MEPNTLKFIDFVSPPVLATERAGVGEKAAWLLCNGILEVWEPSRGTDVAWLTTQQVPLLH